MRQKKEYLYIIISSLCCCSFKRSNLFILTYSRPLHLLIIIEWQEYEQHDLGWAGTGALFLMRFHLRKHLSFVRFPIVLHWWRVALVLPVKYHNGYCRLKHNQRLEERVFKESKIRGAALNPISFANFFVNLWHYIGTARWIIEIKWLEIECFNCRFGSILCNCFLNNLQYYRMRLLEANHVDEGSQKLHENILDLEIRGEDVATIFR